MINLTYDEHGSNGRESYDPRPELNRPRWFATATRRPILCG
jgi:hypothetical protein